ncbi:MAG TPA: TonB-dependent receptor, partial [Bryobacteraceae bacterium]|nr:TonB-dependent receptor [Bryobacteraceae bacterium]
GTRGRFGVVVAVSASSKLQLQSEHQRYLRMGAGSPILFTDYPDYREYSEGSRLGAVLNTSVRLNPNNKLVFRNTYTHDADKSVRQFSGYDGGVGNDIAAERLRYIERSLFSTGLEGEHSLPALGNSLVRWQFAFSRSSRDEPDLREVFRNLLPDGRYVFAGTSTSGLRFFSELDDRIYEPQIDYSIPFFRGSVTGLFKVGYRGTFRKRDFGARRFLFQLNQNTVDLFLPTNQLFAAENIRPDGFQLLEYTRATDAYDAAMNVHAGYGMVDLGLGSRWRLVAGVRVEAAEETVNTLDNLSTSATPVKARLQNTDPAPAVNAIYALTGRQNLRFSYSRTLSRPDFRELSPFDFANTLGGSSATASPSGGAPSGTARPGSARTTSPAGLPMSARSGCPTSIRNPIRSWISPTSTPWVRRASGAFASRPKISATIATGGRKATLSIATITWAGHSRSALAIRFPVRLGAASRRRLLRSVGPFPWCNGR